MGEIYFTFITLRCVNINFSFYLIHGLKEMLILANALYGYFFGVLHLIQVNIFQAADLSTFLSFGAGICG